MSKRGDNIHKRKDGRWEGRYKRGRKPDGTIKYGSVYGSSYREVKEKLEIVSLEKNNTPISKKSEKCFGEILALWMDNNQLRLKGGTINKYQNLIDTHISPALGTIKLSELNSTKINSFLSEKLSSGRIDNKGGLSPSYVRSIMLVISAALNFAVKENMCLPLKSPICKPTINKADISILNLKEQKELESYLIRELDFTETGIFLSLHTGLRIGEVCALLWEDVDLQNKIIKIRHTVARVKSDDTSNTTHLIIDTPKTKASIRDIPISSALLPILMRMKEKSVSPYVISNTNSFVAPRTYEYRYHRILEKCNINSVNYHALRHTFATRCIEAGVDVKSLSEILGHANVGITLTTYVHSSLEMKRSQLEKLSLLCA